jgi:hypothetical protein
MSTRACYRFIDRPGDHAEVVTIYKHSDGWPSKAHNLKVRGSNPLPQSIKSSPRIASRYPRAVAVMVTR